MEFIDSHAHLTNSTVFEEVEALLQRAQRANIRSVINICTDRLTLERGLQLAKQCPFVYNTAATTPHDVEKEGDEMLPFFAQHARNCSLVAIGETGLDYHYEHSPKEIQKIFFKKYLHLALECQLPIVIHCRDAFKDFFEMIDAEYKIQGIHAPGVLHCFTGTLEEAKEVIKRGWFLSLSGIVTFKKSLALQEVAQWVPLEQLLIETDTPYLAPQSQRGRRNEPSFLPEIANFIATLKKIPVEEVAFLTSVNAKRFFNI